MQVVSSSRVQRAWPVRAGGFVAVDDQGLAFIE
jgi:hypothetical protein